MNALFSENKTGVSRHRQFPPERAPFDAGLLEISLMPGDAPETPRLVEGRHDWETIKTGKLPGQD